jgi:uncharacterized protein YjbI with pentapeptide repeats
MNCSVCGQQELNQTSLDLRLDGSYFCELHFPCFDKQGIPTKKFEWSEEEHARILKYFTSQLTLEKPDRVLSAAHLIGDISLSNKDLSRIDLQKALIYGHIDISFCSITSECTLRSLEVRGSLSVQNCSFLGMLSSENIKVSGITYFVNCNFQQDAHLGGSEFKNVCTFENSKFGRYSSFRDVVFNDYACFNNTTFLGYCNFSRAEFKREIIFKHASFHKVTLFEHCRAHSNLNFSSSAFYRAPVFSGAELKANIDISGAKFLDVSSEDAYPAYKRLGILFSEKKIREGELKLYYMEQKSLRVKSRGTLKVMSGTYEILSGYGTSIKRSLLALLIVFARFIDS